MQDIPNHETGGFNGDQDRPFEGSADGPNFQWPEEGPPDGAADLTDASGSQGAMEVEADLLSEDGIDAAAASSTGTPIEPEVDNSQPLALMPAEKRFVYGETYFVGKRLHGRRHFQTGEENIFSVGGEEKIIYDVTDATGANLGYPAGGGGGITIEGKDNISGMAYHTVERDEAFRPKKVIGMRVDEGFAGGLAEALFAKATEGVDSPADSFNSPDDLLHAAYEGSEGFMPGEYEEHEFEYDPGTGLLTRQVETRHYNGSVEKTAHQNYFDTMGRRVGHVSRELVDVNVNDQTEAYDVTQLSVYEHGPERWRETSYLGFRHGLVPWMVKEGINGKYAPSSEITYLRNSINQELWPFHLAVTPSTMVLREQKEAFQQGPGRMELPSWIPKNMTEAVAKGEVGLSDAAAQPYFPEADNVDILWPIGAYHEASNCDEPESATNFINALANREKVVLHNLEDRWPIWRMAMANAMSPQPPNSSQNLSLIAAMHPAFSRELVEPLGLMERANDRRTFEVTLTSLGVTADYIRKVMASHQNLLPGARRRFDYLLRDDDIQ